MNNLDKILIHNNREGATFKMGINQFSDMESAEFKEYNRFRRGNKKLRQPL